MAAPEGSPSMCPAVSTRISSEYAGSARTCLEPHLGKPEEASPGVARSLGKNYQEVDSSVLREMSIHPVAEGTRTRETRRLPYVTVQRRSWQVGRCEIDHLI